MEKDTDENRIQYTGTLAYKEIDFTFVCDGKELKLLPPKDKAHVIEWEWGRKPLGNGAFTFPDPIPVGDEYLIGQCNETKQKIVFLPKSGSCLGIINTTVTVQLFAYVVYKYDRAEYDKLSFCCKELNYIYPINEAYTISMPQGEGRSGVYRISTLDFDSTTTERQTFRVDDREIKVCFGVSRTASWELEGVPLRLESTLVFEFEPTTDYQLAIRLCSIARDFVRYLCYRNNVPMNRVTIASPYKDGLHEPFATMFFTEDNEMSDSLSLKKGRYISQKYISGHEGGILSDIACGRLYLRHLPDSYENGRHINAARFVMITAAFEWEFRRLYPDGIPKTPRTIEAENAVLACINERIEKTTGKQKEIYKFLKKQFGFDSLKSEIVQMGKDFSDLLNVFGIHLYHLNGEELVYTEMGQRLADQRNHFAHGDLDEEFIGLSLLDLIYLELVLYAMQLKRYNVEDKNIRKAINGLFGLRLAID